MKVSITINSENNDIANLDADGIAHLSKWRIEMEEKMNATLKMKLKYHKKHGLWVTPVPFK